MRLASLAAACVVLLPVFGCGGDDEGKVLEGTGYELTVPAGWNDESSAGEDIEVGGFSPDLLLIGDREDGFTTNVNVIRTANPDLGLDAQVRAERELLEEGRLPGSDDEANPARELTPVERTTLAAKEARAYNFQLSQGERTLQLRQVVAMHDDAVYVITLTVAPDGFEDARDALESVLDSWRWR